MATASAHHIVSPVRGNPSSFCFSDELSPIAPVQPSSPRRPHMPPPVQLRRAWHFSNQSQPASPHRPTPQPSPRRLAPLAGALADQAGEADVAAGGGSSCGAPVLDRNVLPQQLLSKSSGGNADGYAAVECRSLERKGHRMQTQEVLAEALCSSSPTSNASSWSPKVVRSRHYRKKHPAPSSRIKPEIADMGATDRFWEAYKATPVDSPRFQGTKPREPAWQDQGPFEAIAAQQELNQVHGRRRHQLLRLIKTGQLPAAARVATGGHAQQCGALREVEDGVRKQLEVMGMQRRGLSEARKMLEKLVTQQPDGLSDATKIELQEKLRGCLLQRTQTQMLENVRRSLNSEAL